MTPPFDVAEHSPRLVRVAAGFAGRKPSLLDVCLIRLSELDPRQPAITVGKCGSRSLVAEGAAPDRGRMRLKSAIRKLSRRSRDTQFPGTPG